MACPFATTFQLAILGWQDVIILTGTAPLEFMITERQVVTNNNIHSDYSSKPSLLWQGNGLRIVHAWLARYGTLSLHQKTRERLPSGLAQVGTLAILYPLQAMALRRTVAMPSADNENILSWWRGWEWNCGSWLVHRGVAWIMERALIKIQQHNHKNDEERKKDDGDTATNNKTSQLPAWLASPMILLTATALAYPLETKSRQCHLGVKASSLWEGCGLRLVQTLASYGVQSVLNFYEPQIRRFFMKLLH